MHPRSSPWLAGITTAALFLYASVSVQIAYARDQFAGFCDSAESDCSDHPLPWTTARVMTWVLWGLAGLVLVATTIVAFRTGARRGVLAGLTVAVALCVSAAAILRTL
jgi:hypothetical protein